MTMQRQDHIWSAILRALLGVRRDRRLNNALDDSALAYLQSSSTLPTSDVSFETHLTSLINDTPLSLVGQKLSSYLDVNRMGNLVVAMISSAHIDASLTLLCKYPEYFFTAGTKLQLIRGDKQLVLRWTPASQSLRDGLYAYLLLSIFRYQAGQRFDVSQASLPVSTLPLLRPVSGLKNTVTDACELIIANHWLTTSSFHENPALLNAIEKSLMPGTSDTTRAQVIACIDAARHPARLRLPAVAAQLGLTEALLRKQLKSEQVSFSHLLKSTIHELATHHLLAGSRAQEVSELLGFSDRRAFDRSFKDYTGINPGQLRVLGSRLRFQRGNQQLSDIVTSLPPLPKSVQSILALNDDTMRVNDVVRVIEQDPIFHAHIMAKASRAVFGRVPSSLSQAISRNLGLANIKSLAVLFAAQQQLSEQSVFHDVERLIDGMLLSERIAVTTQPDTAPALLLFGLLSLLLLFHQDCVFAQRVRMLWQQSEHFAAFRYQVMQDTGVCLYGASSLMLLKWGISGDINRQLWALCETQPAQAPNPVHLCHDVAMNHILPHACEASFAPHQDTLSKAQCDSIQSTLATWQQ